MHEFQLSLSCSGLSIRGLKNFSEGGPEIICFHGWLDNCHSFLPLMTELDQYRVLAIDLPGHGRSDHPRASYGLHFVDYIYNYAELWQDLGLESAHIIGHSMGAAAASLFAGTFPDLCKSLTLIDSCGPLTVEEGEAPERMNLAINAWLRLQGRSNPLYDSFEAACLTRQKAGGLTEDMAKMLTSRGTKEVLDKLSWTHDPRLKVPSYRGFSEAQTRAYLSKISCPSLFIGGSKSPYFGSEIIEERLACIPKLSKKILEGGHHIHMEQAGLCGEAIREFLDR